MALLVVEMELANAQTERWSEALMESGALCVDIADADAGAASEQALYDEPGEEARIWSRSRLTALFDPGTDVAAEVSRLAQALGDAAEYRVGRLDDKDWVREVQAQSEPIAVGERLWIVPSWREPPRPGALNLVVDPGLAFGSGSHPSTRLCLRWLEAHLKGGETVVDYGCGSGILALAAAKLGASRVMGVDIDPQALAASRDNARRNGVEALFLSAEAPLEIAADVLVANILARTLTLLAPAFARMVRPGGDLVLSGVLSAQAPELVAAYCRWFNIAPWEEDEGWVALAGRRAP